MNGRLRRNHKAITLLELLIVISIAGILVGVITLTLQTSLDIYHVVQDDVFLQKVLDDTLQEISDGDFESYGIKDSLELISAGTNAISFVPPWVDDTHLSRPLVREESHQYVLDRPFKAGASLPIGEVRLAKARTFWQSYPLTFYLDSNDLDQVINDRVSFKGPVPLGNKIRFTYHPETKDYLDSIMNIVFGKHAVIREYNRVTQKIPKRSIREVAIKDLNFQYYDNLNREVPADRRTGLIPEDQINHITAVKASVIVSLGEKEKRGSVFMSLRNSRSAGFGLILRPGTTVRIPNSEKVRAFSLNNIIGVQKGDRIKLEAFSSAGQSWAIDVELDIKDGQPVIRKYFVQSPAGSTVYSEQLNLTTDLPLNMLTLGGSGRYDYDIDEEGSDAVNLEGDVELRVVQMDPSGAALFIRP